GGAAEGAGVQLDAVRRDERLIRRTYRQRVGTPVADRIRIGKEHPGAPHELRECEERDEEDGEENARAHHRSSYADNFSQSVSGASSASARPPSEPMNTGSSMNVTLPPPTCFSASSSVLSRPRMSPPPPERITLLRTRSWNSGS